MANPMRGEGSFHAEGTTYTGTMHADALCMAEEVTGKPISVVVALFDSGAHLGMTAALAWAGMFRQYGLPWDGFRDKVMTWGVSTVKDGVASAMKHAWPEPEKEANPRKRGQAKTTAGTGSSS
jgi:hypothetical protein